MLGLPGSAALARRIPLSDLRPPEGVASAPPAVRVCRLWPPDVRHGWDDLPGHPQPAHRLVSGDVGRHQSEDRDERADAAAGAGLGQLPNGLDLAAQAATGDGAARPGPARRLRRSGRDVRRGRRGWRQWPRGQEKGPRLPSLPRTSGQRLGRIRLRRVWTGRVGEQPPGFIDDVVERASAVRCTRMAGWATGACRRTATGTGLRTSRRHPEPGEPTAAARSSRHVPAQAVAVGHPSGRRRPRTSRLLPRRVHASAVQPPALTAPRDAVLPLGASRLCRSPLWPAYTAMVKDVAGEALGETTRCRGHLSQLG